MHVTASVMCIRVLLHLDKAACSILCRRLDSKQLGDVIEFMRLRKQLLFLR